MSLCNEKTFEIVQLKLSQHKYVASNKHERRHS